MITKELDLDTVELNFRTDQVRKALGGLDFSFGVIVLMNLLEEGLAANGRNMVLTCPYNSSTTLLFRISNRDEIGALFSDEMRG